MTSRFPIGFLTVAVVLTGAILAWFAWSTYDSNRDASAARDRDVRVAELQGTITHLDEVLTMSARMAAATGDMKWEKRYQEFEPTLGAAITEAIQIAPETYSGQAAAQSDAANMKLVEMETRAFELVRNGRAAEAHALLFSGAYVEQKRLYAEGMRLFGERLTKAAHAAVEAAEDRILTQLVITASVMPILLIAWLIALRTLNNWRQALSDNNRQLARQADDLSELLKQVQESGLQVATAAAQLAASNRKLEAMMTRQVSSTQAVVTTAREIAENSQELATTMEEVTRISEEASASAETSRTGLQGMEASTKTMSDASREIGDRLCAIQHRAESITSIITTITQVTDQTNLLSLNAAIEAEKAGEYGRGFAVVAQEIQRLADNTAEAAVGIETMVAEMTSSVAEGVQGTARFTGEVRRATADVGSVGTKLGQIVDHVRTLASRFETVARGVREHSLGAQQISDSMLDLQQTLEETDASLHESSRAVEQLNHAAQGLTGLISRFGREGN